MEWQFSRFAWRASKVAKPYFLKRTAQHMSGPNTYPWRIPLLAMQDGCSHYRSMSQDKRGGGFPPESESGSDFRPLKEGVGKEPWIPEYENRFHEHSDEKRNRLKYQSRKRGIAENGLLLGTFADKYLESMTGV